MPEFGSYAGLGRAEGQILGVIESAGAILAKSITNHISDERAWLFAPNAHIGIMAI